MISYRIYWVVVSLASFKIKVLPQRLKREKFIVGNVLRKLFTEGIPGIVFYLQPGVDVQFLLFKILGLEEKNSKSIHNLSESPVIR
jgi:hypothetical protein